jgi:DNA-binding LytR/AlgR family response regulator
VLLDVQMPRMDGFAVVHAVGPERMPAVIFVTGHGQYAICAFEIAAIDYLLKPVTEKRFSLAFERASSRIRMHVPMNTVEGVLNPERFLRIHRSHIVNVQEIGEDT